VIKLRALKMLMAERKLDTQRQLAEACGLRTPHLNRILNAKHGITTPTINRLCAGLRCQPGEILEYIPDEE